MFSIDRSNYIIYKLVHTELDELLAKQRNLQDCRLSTGSEFNSHIAQHAHGQHGTYLVPLESGNLPLSIRTIYKVIRAKTNEL